MLKFIFLVTAVFLLGNCSSPRKVCYESKCGTTASSCMLKQSLFSTGTVKNTSIIKQTENDLSKRNNKTNDFVKGSLPFSSFKDKIEVTASLKNKDDVDNYYFQPSTTATYDFSLKDKNTAAVASCALYLYSSNSTLLISDTVKSPADATQNFTKKSDLTEKAYKFSVKNETEANKKNKHNHLFVHCKPKDASKITKATPYFFNITVNGKTTTSSNSLKGLTQMQASTSYSSYMRNENLKKSMGENAAKSVSCQESKAACYKKCDSAFPF